MVSMESLQHITPRWEWRTFADHPLEAADQLRELQLVRSTQSEEHYILLPDSGFNLKIRNDQFEIKALIERAPDQLEKWMPIYKSSFPLVDFDWTPWPELQPA